MKRREFVKKSLGIVGASTLFGSKKVSANDLRPEQLSFDQVKALPIGTHIPCEICPQRRFNPDRCVWGPNIYCRKVKNGDGTITLLHGCIGLLRINRPWKHNSGKYCVQMRLSQGVTEDKIFHCSMSIGLVKNNRRHAHGHGYTKEGAIRDAVLKALIYLHFFD